MTSLQLQRHTACEAVCEPERLWAALANTMAACLPLSKEKNSSTAVTTAVFDFLNSRRIEEGTASLQWSHRLRLLATRAAKAVAEGWRTAKPRRQAQRKKIVSLLDTPCFRVGETVELIKVISEGTLTALETAKAWAEEATASKYSCIGIGMARSPVGGRLVLAAYLVEVADASANLKPVRHLESFDEAQKEIDAAWRRLGSEIDTAKSATDSQVEHEEGENGVFTLGSPRSVSLSSDKCDEVSTEKVSSEEDGDEETKETDEVSTEKVSSEEDGD